jgi:hypothetical protein
MRRRHPCQVPVPHFFDFDHAVVVPSIRYTLAHHSLRNLLRKPNSEDYREFRILFEAHEPALLPEFDEKVKNSAPLKVFMWLQSLRARKELWESLDPLLTDFFYSNH